MGLPGCVMYAKATVFDLMLPRIAAGVPVTRSGDSRSWATAACAWAAADCRYPICPFGKGISQPSQGHRKGAF